MLSLPDEIIIRIGNYLPDKDMAHLAQVDSRLSQTLSDSLFKRASEDQPPPVVKIPALLWAIHFGHTSLVKRIISQPNFRTYNQYGALDLATKLGHADMIPILISAGYEIGHSLHTAAINGHDSTVSQLLKHGAPIHQIYQDMTPLVSAIYAPWTIWKSTPSKGIAAKDGPLLVQEIEEKAVATIQILLNNGAQSQIRTVDAQGNTPLHHAVFSCVNFAVDRWVGSGILRLLVQAGASLTARNQNNFTPLELAVCYPTASSTALNFFLDIGLSPNTKFEDGRSLLSNAVICHDKGLRVIQVLLNRGATTDDVNLLEFFYDQEYPDPLFDKILILLLIHGATFGDEASQCFTYAARLGMLDVMKTVLETCPGIDLSTSVDRNGSMQGGTPLQLAISGGRADIVKFLVERGVEISKLEREQVEAMLG